MTISPPVNRRTVLAAGAAGAGALALAACSGSDSSGADDSTSKTAQTGPKALIPLDDIPVGEAKSVKLPDGSPGIVARPSANSAACFSAVCTHMGCTVEPKGKELDCPCHGSRYNALTGAVIQGPAPKALKKVSVSVRNGQVVAG